MSLKNEPWQVSGLKCNIVLVARDKNIGGQWSRNHWRGDGGSFSPGGSKDAPSCHFYLILWRCTIMSPMQITMLVAVVHNNCIRIDGNLQTLKIIFLSIIAIYPFFVCSKSFWRKCNSLLLSLQKDPPSCALYSKFIKHEKMRSLGVNENNRSSDLTSKNKAKRTADPGLNSDNNSKYQHQ